MEGIEPYFLALVCKWECAQVLTQAIIISCFSPWSRNLEFENSRLRDRPGGTVQNNLLMCNPAGIERGNSRLWSQRVDHHTPYPPPLILYGDSNIGTHVRSNLCYLICLRHLLISREVTNRIFFLRKDQFSSMRGQHIFRYHLM